MLLEGRANLPSKIRGERYTLRIWRFPLCWLLCGEMEERGAVWFRRYSEKKQQRGQDLQESYCRWRNGKNRSQLKEQQWLPTEGTARSDRKKRERGELENPLIITDLTLHPDLAPSPPAQIMVTFARDPHQSSWEQISWSTTGSITSCSLSALLPPASREGVRFWSRSSSG